MKNSYFVCILVSLALFSMLVMAGCASSPGGATAPFTADIYVSTTGSNDAGDGSFSKPYRTIQFGLYKAGTNEVVGVLAGTYIESILWPTTWEGITLRGIARNTAILSAEANKRCIGIAGTPSPQTITIESMTIMNGYSAVSNGGGIYLEVPITVDLRNVKLHNNTGFNGGGLHMAALADKVIINNCVFSSNETYDDTGSGGSICHLGGTLIMNNSEIYENYGGWGNFFSNQTLEVTGCNIHDNTSTHYGAGLAFTSNALPRVTNTTIEGNDLLTSGYGGGAIYSEGPSIVTIEGCTIKGNGAFDYGGGVYCNAGGGGGDIMYIKKCKFYDNHAYSGGAIHADNQVELEKCLFMNNTAESGNGGALSLASNGTAEIVNSIFKFNKSSSEGGGIYFSGIPAEMEILNCTFVSNESANVGSAIEMSNGNEVTIINCIFWLNKYNGSSIWEVYSASGSPGYDISYCNYAIGAISGTHTFTGNTNTAPTFVLYPDNLHLSDLCTIEVTKGGTTLEGAPDDDYIGTDRIGYNSMGAYQWESSAP